MERAIGRPILRTADLAFLCPSNPDHPIAQPVLAWITGQRDPCRRVVAISINAALCRTSEAFAHAHAPLMRRLIDSAVSLVLVPHDTRREKTDEHFLRLALGALPDAAMASTVLLPAVDAPATKAVLGAVDLLVSSRIHPAILAAGGGCATLSYAYQGKFEGLYRMLGLDEEGLVFRPSDLMEDPIRMAAITLDALANARALGSRIAQRLPGIVDLAMANFGH